MMLLVTNVEFSMAHFWICDIEHNWMEVREFIRARDQTAYRSYGKLHIFYILRITIYFKVSMFSFIFLEV